VVSEQDGYLKEVGVSGAREETINETLGAIPSLRRAAVPVRRSVIGTGSNRSQLLDRCLAMLEARDEKVYGQCYT
jgi:hypothetical protein